jgi:hypothetical protein
MSKKGVDSTSQDANFLLPRMLAVFSIQELALLNEGGTY